MPGNWSALTKRMWLAKHETDISALLRLPERCWICFSDLKGSKQFLGCDNCALYLCIKNPILRRSRPWPYQNFKKIAYKPTRRRTFV